MCIKVIKVRHRGLSYSIKYYHETNGKSRRSWSCREATGADLWAGGQLCPLGHSALCPLGMLPPVYLFVFFLLLNCSLKKSLYFIRLYRPTLRARDTFLTISPLTPVVYTQLLLLVCGLQEVL